MNLALINGSSAIRRFEDSDEIETRDGITFDFYTGGTATFVLSRIQTLEKSKRRVW